MRCKGISLVIIVIFLVTFAGNVFGVGGDMGVGTDPCTNGTVDHPYLIEDITDFNAFSNDPNYWAGGVHTRLDADIDLAGEVYTTAVIAPDIDNSSYEFDGEPFFGVFDGSSHIVSNLKIDTNDIGNDYLGLFGYIGDANAVVRNLGIEDVNIIGGSYSFYLGGLCGGNGRLPNSGGEISTCFSTGFIIGGEGSEKIGGLCGGNTGNIRKSYSTCSVRGTYHPAFIGGFCGYNVGGTISNCYSAGDVTSGVYARYIGGFSGHNDDGNINNCYSTGFIRTDINTSRTGGFCANGQDEEISNSYYFVLAGPDNNLGTSLNDIDIQSANSFSGFDFVGDVNDGIEEIWDIESGYCPKLSWQGYDGPIAPDMSELTTLAGSGYSWEPFQINSDVDFNEFHSNDLLRYGDYILNTDIDLSGEIFDKAVISRIFEGGFDGNGHVIHNMTIEAEVADNNYIGLFGNIGNLYSEITDLGIEDINIIAGDNSLYVGGLAGYNLATINRCYSTGTISGDESVGGIVGITAGNINDCYSSVNVVGRLRTGGFCGYNSGSIISSCYSTGNITGEDAVGGLCGLNVGFIRNCYSTSVVSGDYKIGGFCGYNDNGDISSCYSAGFTFGNGYLNSLCGVNENSTISNSYFSLFHGEGNYLGIALSDVEMTDGNSFEGFDFIETWEIVSGHCPKLSWESGDGPLLADPPFMALTGKGTEANPYLIQSLSDFNEFAANSDYWAIGIHTKLACDIDLSGEVYSRAVIISDVEPFSGVFDGGGHVIRNLTIDTNGEDADYIGLFGYIEGPNTIVKNLGVEDVNITVTRSFFVGGLCGYGVFCEIDNCYSTGSVLGSAYVGGLIGGIDSNIKDSFSTCSVTGYKYVGGCCGANISSISNSYSTGPVKALEGNGIIGGFCGANEGGVISFCYSTSSVTAEYYSAGLGGFCGINTSIISNSYSMGSVLCDDEAFFIGGFCGGNYGGFISDCYSAGTINTGDDSVEIGGLCGENLEATIFNSYSYSSITVGTNCEYIGGFCGISGGSDMNNSFWDVNSSGMLVGYNLDPEYPGGGVNVVGKTTSEMQTESTFTSAGWDFVGAWWINELRDYPRLWWQPFGDLNNDSYVNMLDVAVMGLGWFSGDGDVNFNSVCELSGDWVIDEADLAELGAAWLAGPVW